MRERGEKIDLDLLDHKRDEEKKAMLIPEMELHYSLKSCGFAEVNAFAMAVQREISALGDSKDCDVQRKLQQCCMAQAETEG